MAGQVAPSSRKIRAAAGLIVFFLGLAGGWMASDRLFTRDLSIEREITGAARPTCREGR